MAEEFSPDDHSTDATLDADILGADHRRPREAEGEEDA